MVNRYDADGCQSATGHYVSYEDYAALQKERNALKQLMQLAYDSLSADESVHWVGQAINNLDAWLDK
nr:MAG TPA: hypothetical protein [Caudoviricetes sp.]